MHQELEATFDGTAFQLEKPLNLAAGTKVRIVIEEVLPNQQKQLKTVLPTAKSLKLQGEPDWSDKDSQDSSETNISTLLNSLTDKDIQTRSQAALALGKLGSEDAVPALSHALITDQAAEVRRSAAKALGIIGSADAEAKG
ncbi:MAG: HEAT repeat domain-containing protein [Xenococcus sp. MO_188.B8]|nr:HEAT repeat domain-containing protein [Xenococcus sp. MO_188.B8]